MNELISLGVNVNGWLHCVTYLSVSLIISSLISTLKIKLKISKGYNAGYNGYNAIDIFVRFVFFYNLLIV